MFLYELGYVYTHCSEIKPFRCSCRLFMSLPHWLSVSLKSQKLTEWLSWHSQYHSLYSGKFQNCWKLPNPSGSSINFSNNSSIIYFAFYMSTTTPEGIDNMIVYDEKTGAQSWYEADKWFIDNVACGMHAGMQHVTCLSIRWTCFKYCNKSIFVIIQIGSVTLKKQNNVDNNFTAQMIVAVIYSQFVVTVLHSYWIILRP